MNSTNSCFICFPSLICCGLPGIAPGRCVSSEHIFGCHSLQQKNQRNLTSKQPQQDGRVPKPNRPPTLQSRFQLPVTQMKERSSFGAATLKLNQPRQHEEVYRLDLNFRIRTSSDNRLKFFS